MHHIECSLEPGEFRQLVDLSRQERDLKPLYEPYLPPAAYAEKFGMSDVELEFLLKQRYGNTFLKRRSGIY